MIQVKMPTSDRHRDFQIECLKNPEHAAAYIEAILEEEDPEPQLLRNALRKVIEARFRSKLLSKNDEFLHQRLDAMLTKSGCGEIYALVEFLNAVDLKLTIPLKANRMKNNRLQTSDRWQDALIESLKYPEHAAGFIEAILSEKDPEPQLLSAALKDVIDARSAMQALSESAKEKYEQLEKILSQSGGAEIYTFVELLEALGFKLAIE